jgi:hypothetical protein
MSTGLNMKKSVLLHRIGSVLLTLCLLPAATSVVRAADSMVPLELKLPAPALKGTPKDIPLTSNIEPASDKPRPPMLVPSGLANIAKKAKLSCSDKNATQDTLEKLTDGDKEASDQNVVSLRKGSQWIQMDFGTAQEIFAVVIWHAYNSGQVYHDVVVRVADDADFVQNVRTVFNNDYDNSSGLGVGTEREYFESNEGKLIDAKGVKARYIRFYSKGSSDGALNEYTEIEVYGRPAN